MPTYEYECHECGFWCERVQRITDEPLAQCPRCGGTMERVIAGGSGVIFRGKGFYKTDYHGGPGSSWGTITPYRTNRKSRQ